MNFDKLNAEYNSYWQNHDLGKAINSLQAIAGYLGSDWSLLSPSTALKPENLLSRYAYDNGYAVSQYQTIADTISYSTLLKHYSQYLNGLIQEVVDYETKLKAQQEKNIFDSLIESLLSPLGIPITLWLAVGVLLYFIFKD
jgi:hypothetical protein